jgi:hypothetical protein
MAADLAGILCFFDPAMANGRDPYARRETLSIMA